MVGAIIGKGGAKINEIRQLSGSVIKINEPQDNSNERLVTITGTQECNQMALYMLYSRLGKFNRFATLSTHNTDYLTRERKASNLELSFGCFSGSSNRSALLARSVFHLDDCGHPKCNFTLQIFNQIGKSLVPNHAGLLPAVNMPLAGPDVAGRVS